MSRGVLLVNLGSPDSPNVSDVRCYLHQFLMDPRVLDVPYLLRKYIVCCQVLPKRPRQTAHAYQAIWTQEGSPLLVMSERVRRFVQERVKFPVVLGMRYGNPSIRAALLKLLQHDVSEILLIPQYPHYAMSSYETAVVEVQAVLGGIQKKNNLAVKLTVVPPFFEKPDYIASLVECAESSLLQGFDHLLFTYHGVPLRHLQKTDPSRCYRTQTQRTTDALVRALKLSEGQYSLSYQSRFGKDEWLSPFTEETLKELAARGVKKLVVMSPGFTVDCLETLEEIGIRGKEIFLGAGGKEFVLIPCLNDHPFWIQTLASWCER